MRQRRWVELLNDYDCEISYHPGKANVVTDALSRRSYLHSIRDPRACAHLETLIRQAQYVCFNENTVKEEINCGAETQLIAKSDGIYYYLDRIWIPARENLRNLLMIEAHKSRYSIHPGADKMYQDLRSKYWRPGKKKDIALYVAKCLTCSKVKAEH